MVKRFSDGEQLDRIFHALADQSRRTILMLLSTGERRVTEIAANFPFSLPAVSKHLKVLEQAGLIEREVRGRDHYFRVRREYLREATAQTALLSGYWGDVLEGLERQHSHEEDQDGRFKG